LVGPSREKILLVVGEVDFKTRLRFEHDSAVFAKVVSALMAAVTLMEKSVMEVVGGVVV
jgi:hypothetical protein